jgi:hypothetical protein
MLSQTVQKTLECFSAECLHSLHKNCDKPGDRLSFRILLVEGLFSKYGATTEEK